MALEKQTVTIPLAKGIDTKSDPKLVSDSLLELENAVFTSTGQIQKRYGLNSLGRKDTLGEDVDSARSLAIFQNELGLISDSAYYSYSKSSSAWVEKSKIAGVYLNTLSLVRNNNTQSVPDIAINVGLVVYAYEDSGGGIRTTVIDQTTGSILINNYQLSATGIKPKCSYAGDYILVWYAEGTILKCRRISNSKPLQFEVAINVTLDLDASAVYDIAKFGNNNVIAYKNLATHLVTAYLKNTGEIASAIDGYVSPVTIMQTADSIAIHPYYVGDAAFDCIYICYFNSTNGTLIFAWDLNLANRTSIRTVDASTAVTRNITLINTDKFGVQIFYEVAAAATYNNFIKTNTFTRSGFVGSNSVILRSVGLLSKAFFGYDGGLYFLTAHESKYQSTSYLVRYDNAKASIINRISYQNSGGLTAKVSSLANVIQSSEYLWSVPNIIKNQLESESGIVFSNKGVSRALLNFNTANLFNTAQLGANLHICAGMLLVYDGVNLVESGYNLYPENITGSVDDSSGNLVAGTRQWVIVYEWSDVQGQIHRSAPSIPKTFTTSGGTSKVTLTIPTLRLTYKEGVSVVVYRTVAAGTVFYRTSPIVNPTLNDPTVDTVGYVDNVADSALIGNELLYTTGGILENIAPPSCTIPYVYNNRLVLAGLENPNEIWISRESVPNEAVNFSDLIVTRIDQGQVGIKAVSQLDEKIVYFKENNIYLQVFNGPTDTGANNDIGIPQALTTDTGCISHKSAIFYPNGIIFKSKKGFYELSRSLQLSYIGAPVEAYNNLICTGSVLIDENNQIRFSHSDGDAVVYDYFVGQWCTFTNYSSIAAKRWGNTYVIARESGQVDAEDKSTYLDNFSSIKMRLVTPWIKVAGIQGLQRVYGALLLGQFNSPHNLRVRIGYNYANSWREDYNIDAGAVLGNNYFGEDPTFGDSAYFGGTGESVYQFKIDNAFQKCQSIRYEISDFNRSAQEGSCMNITALTLVVGIKKGEFKVPKIKNL